MDRQGILPLNPARLNCVVRACLCLLALGLGCASPGAGAALDDALSLNGSWSFLLCEQEASGPQGDVLRTGVRCIVMVPDRGALDVGIAGV